MITISDDQPPPNYGDSSTAIKKQSLVSILLVVIPLTVGAATIAVSAFFYSLTLIFLEVPKSLFL